MANSVDPDQMPLNAASDLDLHCLLRLVITFSIGTYRLYERLASDQGLNCLSLIQQGFIRLINPCPAK